MGRVFLSEEQPISRENMDVFNNPSKRIRLDLSNNFDANLPDDDIWGEEDLTADEFDKLEFQATQSHRQDDTPRTFVQPLPPAASNNVSLAIEDETKQQLYELEGKVKLLSHSLEKASNQLKEEKLKRDKMVKEKLSQSLVKENELRKEIKKVESSLQFKNQEMKCLYEKVHLLETQLKEKKEQIVQPTAQTSNSFLEKFQFDASTSKHNPELIKEHKPRSRKNKLLVDAPRGKIQGTNIISTLLCNKLTLNPVPNYPSISAQTRHSLEPTSKTGHRLSAVSILRLSSDQQAEELFDYFSCVFKNYLKSLSVMKTDLNSPSYVKRKEIKQDQAIVIACLKDLAYIASSSQFLSVVQKYSCGPMNLNQVSDGASTSKSNLFPVYKQQSNEPGSKVSSLLQSLVLLASPDSYPVNYSKNEEVELSFTCLVSWSTLAPESFTDFNEDIPYQSIMCCYEETNSLMLSIKFLTNLCIHKKFISLLFHKDDFCLLCTLSSLMVQKIAQNPSMYTTVMLSIEDFLSASFTLHSFQELKLDSSPCSALVLQAIIISLWKFYAFYKESSHDVILILKKGFSLVELLSKYLPNFKEMRLSCEDSYISLVCGMLDLSKETPNFKDLYDLLHDLWDFQEDTSEFDLDEPCSEDSSPTAEIAC